MRANNDSIIFLLNENNGNPIFVGNKLFDLEGNMLKSAYIYFTYNEFLTLKDKRIICQPRLTKQRLTLYVNYVDVDSNTYVINKRTLYAQPYFKAGYFINSFERSSIAPECIIYPNTYKTLLEYISLPVIFESEDILFYNGFEYNVQKFGFLTPKEHDKLIKLVSVINSKMNNIQNLRKEYYSIYKKLFNIAKQNFEQ